MVRVRAQVMTRDDSSGGWVPLSGGGLANVSVRRRATSGVHQTNNTNGTGISTTTNSAHPISNTTVGPQSHGSSSISPPGANKRKHEYLIYGKRITDQSVSYTVLWNYRIVVHLYFGKKLFKYLWQHRVLSFFYKKERKYYIKMSLMRIFFSSAVHWK